jgi:proline iminopeptidase
MNTQLLKIKSQKEVVSKPAEADEAFKKSIRLAGLVGPAAVLLGLTETLNLHIWTTNLAQVTYLNGALLFIAGLSIIRIHNIWKGWPVLITLAGWILFFGGMYRMIAPEAKQAGETLATYAVFTLLFLGGIYLTFRAYGKKIRNDGTSTTRYGFLLLLLLLALFQLALATIHLHVPRTTQFDNTLPYTEINGYRFHTEIFGSADATPLIIVHGGPGLDYEYLKALKNLSNNYRVIFYDQRGSGLSPRVDNKFLTIEQNLDDLHSIVQHFSNGQKVKLLGHSWGATLVVGYLSKHPEMVSQAVIVEPFILYPGDPVKEWVEKFKRAGNVGSFWDVASALIYYPFVRKEDGQEGYEYIGTKIAGKNKPGPPYNCAGQDLPPHSFKRMGFEAYNTILKPIMDNPNSLQYDFTEGIAGYHGDLMLMSGTCSILGPAYQEKYAIPKLPPQTVHVKAVNMGHHMITLNPDWSLATIRKFFTP